MYASKSSRDKQRSQQNNESGPSSSQSFGADVQPNIVGESAARKYRDYKKYKLNSANSELIDELIKIASKQFQELDISSWSDVPEIIKDNTFQAITKTLRDTKDDKLMQTGLTQDIYDDAKKLFIKNLEWKGYRPPSDKEAMGLLHLFSAMEGARYINHHARVNQGYSSGSYHKNLDDVVSIAGGQLAKSGGEYTVGYSQSKKQQVQAAKAYLNTLNNNSKFISSAFESALNHYQNEKSAQGAKREYLGKTMYRGTRMRANSIERLDNAARAGTLWTAKQFLSVSPEEKETPEFAAGTFGEPDKQHQQWKQETRPLTMSFSSAGAMPTVMTSEIEFIFPAGTKFKVTKTNGAYHLSKKE